MQRDEVSGTIEGASAASSEAKGPAGSASMNSDGGGGWSALSGGAAPAASAPPGASGENFVDSFKQNVENLDASVHGKWLCLKSLDSYQQGRCRYASLAVQLGMSQGSLDEALEAWLEGDPRARRRGNGWVWPSPSTIGGVRVQKATRKEPKKTQATKKK